MIEPEQYLKFQIKSQLHMDGVYVEGRQLDNIVNLIFESLFSKDTVASVRSVLIDIQSEREEWW